MEGGRRRADDAYGFHPSPFGTALVMATDARAAGLAFADAGEEKAALADMRSRWPKARLSSRTRARPRRLHAHLRSGKLWRADRPLRVVLIGTDFEVRVWETLLKMPMGRATTYSDIAGKVSAAKAARAVGAAVGKNPLSFVVPCHRVLGKSGDITGYHWGLTRKRAMLGWEAGRASRGVQRSAARSARGDRLAARPARIRAHRAHRFAARVAARRAGSRPCDRPRASRRSAHP